MVGAEVRPNSHRYVVLGLLLASLVPLVAAYRYPAFLNDDALITLAYAKNLARGDGFVFNHPPAVLGTTTPLFTLVVAGLAAALPFGDAATVAVWLTALCWLGVAWAFLIFRKEWGLEPWQAGVLGLVVLASGWLDFLGMEAYPFALLLVLTFSLWLGERHWLAGLVAGLLFLTRGEGALIVGVLLAATFIRGWRRARAIDRQLFIAASRIVGGSAAPVLAWAAYAQLTFGAILPNTLAAKQAQGENGLGRAFLARLLEDWYPLWGAAYGVNAVPLLNLWWIFVLIGLGSACLRRPQWLLFAGWIGLYIFGYVLLDVSAYWWYQLPILFVLNLCFALGIVQVIELLVDRVRPRALAWALGGALTGTLLLGMAPQTLTAIRQSQGDPRGASYTVLARWLREHTAPAASVAFIEVGYLGYYTDNRIVDLFGLTTPDIVPHIAVGDFAWGFWQHEPDYFVHLADFDWALGQITQDARFAQRYRQVVALPGPREADFVVYERRVP